MRWRDLDGTVDVGGFVTVDGCQYGGRLIKARSYAPAVFSRIQTSSMYSRPLSFPSHSPGEWPWSLGDPCTSALTLFYLAHHVRTPLGGTITLEVHVVASGETRIHEGLSDLAAQRLCCSSQAPLLASLLPSSSTEVASLGKIATFIFRYRTISKWLLPYSAYATDKHVAFQTSCAHMDWLPSKGNRMLVYIGHLKWEKSVRHRAWIPTLTTMTSRRRRLQP